MNQFQGSISVVDQNNNMVEAVTVGYSSSGKVYNTDNCDLGDKLWFIHKVYM